MLFHLSIDADNPRRVAEVFAEIWQGKAVPFSPVAPGSWMVMAGDERNTLIEVYPRGTKLVRARGESDPQSITGDHSQYSSTHMAIGTQRSMEDILAIAEREGWDAKYRKRGGAFGVVEVWVEGWRMVEILTPDMQQEYLAMARR